MKKNPTKYFVSMNSLFIYPWIGLFLILFSSQSQSQTISVNGKVVASRYPVKNALVTFIDIADTINKFSALTDASGNYQISIPTSVESDNLPTKFELEQSYPNPFSSSAAIPYQLKKESNVQVTIYDILGREVRKFNVGLQSVGLHNVLWDGLNNFGQLVTSGIYFYRLQAGGEAKVKKMIFNQDGRGSVPVPGIYSSISPKINLSKRQGLEAGYYNVRVENSNNTSPLVAFNQLDNVLLQRDTTINFSVNYKSAADVDFNSLHQYIRGFGAANILPWRPDMTDSEIQTAFGTGDGQLGFSILRIMVQPDSNQWSRNLATAKKAHDMGVLVFASPWDPPSNMLNTVNGQKVLRNEMYSDYAAHLNSFNTYMNKNGVPLYAISVQNEPDYGDWTRWTANEIFTFMKNNAQDIGTRVIAPESFQFRREMSDPILNDSTACANLDIVGGHIYGG